MRRIVSGFIVALLLSGLLALAFTVQPVKAQSETIYINHDGSISSPVTANITTTDNITYTFTGNNYLPIVVNRSNIIINGNGHTLQTSRNGNGFSLTGMSNVTIKNTTITNSTCGIFLASSSGNVLSGNNITANYDRGIYLSSSSDNVLSSNIVTSNGGYGIGIYESFGNTLSGNDVTLNSVDGIDFTYASNNNTLSRNLIEANGLNGLELYYSSNNIFSGNNITKNRNLGIFLTSSPSNVFSGNNITANNYAGLDLYYYSSNNVLSGNTFRSNNHYGVAAGYCTGNRIFHNNFLNNTPQASVSNSTDIWDDGYPSGGNYWSNYTGVDQKNGLYQNQTGSDGIGDTPYVINANNTDHYPLMGTFYNYSVYLRVPPFNVTVISNSTITGFTYGIWLENQEHFIKFNVTGKQGSTGFCRVSIPTAMMNDTFTVSVNDTKIPYSLLPCSNATVSYLYFTYTHSTEQVIIVPEFPSFLILPLLMIITLLGTIIFKRKRKVEN